MSGEPQFSGADGRRRADRRAFVKAHHPDRGGDPDAFRAGLAAFDAEPRVTSAAHRPIVHRSRRPGRQLLRGWRVLRRRMRGQPARRLL